MASSFTVAIPTHDRRETALLAARSALAQTRPPEQVVVLCDGCTDGSVEALRALGDERLEVLDLPKLPGYGYAHRNTALERARGDVITWLADDDLLLPDHLERLAEYWDVGAADIVTAPAVVVDPDDGVTWLGEDWGVPEVRRDTAERNMNVMASVSVRAQLVRDVGGWDGSLPRWADWDLWRRCLQAGAVAWATAEPTVLHFRATGRDQAWPDRVRQNSAWAARLEDPHLLADLRRVLRRARGLRDAIEREGHRSMEDALAFEREQSLRVVNALREAGEASARERDDARAQCALLAADRDDARETLARIYAGGWWRLRERSLPLRRRLGR